jgi:hypothetical protein
MPSVVFKTPVDGLLEIVRVTEYRSNFIANQHDIATGWTRCQAKRALTGATLTALVPECPSWMIDIHDYV